MASSDDVSNIILRSSTVIGLPPLMFEAVKDGTLLDVEAGLVLGASNFDCFSTSSTDLESVLAPPLRLTKFMIIVVLIPYLFYSIDINTQWLIVLQ